MVKSFNFCFMTDFFNRYIWGNCNERERERGERLGQRENIKFTDFLT